MARGDKGPSKWWFWGFPAVGIAYLLIAIALYEVLGPAGFWASLPHIVVTVAGTIGELFLIPARLFAWRVADPLLGALQVEPLSLAGWVLFLGLWELAAALLGMICYGVALLVYAIAPEPGGEREGDTGGSG